MASTGLNSSVPDAEVPASAGIVVALMSHNDAGTIGAVARALQEGLARYFESTPARFVLADGGSSDGTRHAARDAVGPSALVEVDCPRVPESGEMPYHGHPGRAAALRAILRTGQDLGARACAVIDAGLQTVEPDWIERLIGPVLAGGFDYVSPYYDRHVNEGAITRGIVYPVFRALYGARLRQPASSEFACSGRLVAHYLEQDFWEDDHASVAINLWLAVTAVCSEFRTCEATLRARGATSRGQPADLSTTLAQIMGALFADLEHRVDVWQRVRGSVAIPVFGTGPASVSVGPPLDLDGLLEAFRLGYRELREIWTWVLPPRTIVELRKIAAAPPERFTFDDRLWATIVYDFAFGYSMRILPHDHLLRSFAPLYSGWLASFALQMGDAPQAQVEERIERLCLGFEAEKRYLISRWRWPERLR